MSSTFILKFDILKTVGEKRGEQGKTHILKYLELDSQSTKRDIEKRALKRFIAS